MKPILHFSHANGFPAGVYRTLLDIWRVEFDVRAIDRIGHDARFPVDYGWAGLVDELLASIDAPGTAKVWLVGHSLGGFVSLLAALKAPQRVHGVVLLDSPIYSGYRAVLLRVSQWVGLDERFSPAAVTRNRRTEWPDLDSVVRHFRSKPAFAIWDEAMLNDYAAHGTRQRDLGPARELVFARETEYRIYRTLPAWIGRKVAHGAPVPVAFLAGTKSVEMRQAGSAGARRLAGARFEWIEGGHLFPMQRPVETAHRVLALLHGMGA